MRKAPSSVRPFAVVVAALALFPGAQVVGPPQERLAHHRNLGKAFYENPTTQAEAVAQFRQALQLAPSSARERVNHGLALLRAGKAPEGVAELLKAQQQDPSIPHTWFNLGIHYKKEGDAAKAIEQLERFVKLVPEEAVGHYNLGVLHKQEGRMEEAIAKFEWTVKLDANLAGPHFQLYNAYRTSGRAEDAQRELKVFQEIKKRQQGAAVPEDLEWCFYSEIYEPMETVPAPVGIGGIGLTAVRFRPVPATALRTGAAEIDSVGSGRTEVLEWSPAGVRVAGKPVAGTEGAMGVARGDFDNDGLVDLLVLLKGSAKLFRNAKGSFAPVEGAAFGGEYRAALWVDYDHDYDVDLLLLGESSALFRNNGDGTFAGVSAAFPLRTGTAIAAVALDTVPDTDGLDVLVAYEDGALVLYRDRMNGVYEALPLNDDVKASRLLAADFDNDSWTDVVAETAGGGVLLRNVKGKLTRAGVLAGTGAVTIADLRNRGSQDVIVGSLVYRNDGLAKFVAAEKLPHPALAAADVNGDGWMDLLTANSTLLNGTVPGLRWLRVGLKGVKNLRLAPGAEVEVKAGSLYQKRLYEGVPLVFGLYQYREVDTVRITWPNGLIQNEARQPAGKSAMYEEAQRLSGSCPMIFTWNGKEFEFITDVLGVAPLGAAAGDGKFFPVDHDEYVQIPGEKLKRREDGRYEIRITEELREVSYLDQIRLLTVDHPASASVFTSDKFQGPPFPEFRLYGVKERIYPVAARNHRGRDVREPLLRADRAYAGDFQRRYDGTAELHHLELDFGAGTVAKGAAAILVLSGWVDWADGSTFLGASQAKSGGLVMPYLQVQDEAGRWRTVVEDMGIPAGKPKTIVVDLSGKFLSASRKVRIVTNLCVYWDEIFLSLDAASPDWRPRELPLRAANLRFRGFSRPLIHPERKQPETFDYQQWMPVSMWNPTPGMYTRYGDVRALLAGIDDRMVIMGSGDELRLEFDADALAPPPKGWKRDFLLFVDGWAKDGDANTAYSKTVDPLPFHGMSGYPYRPDERFPETPEHRRWRSEFNTRPALRLIRPLSAHTAQRLEEQR